MPAAGDAAMAPVLSAYVAEVLAGLFPAPPEPPSDFPRAEWTSSSFGYPGWHNPGVVSDDSLRWAAKKASLATRDAMESGNWSGLDPATTVPLIVLDKCLQLNAYARDRRSSQGLESLMTFDDWVAERKRDVIAVYDKATVIFPLSFRKHAPLSHVIAIVTAALHVVYDQGTDAFGLPPKTAPQFPPSWLGQHAATASDIEPYGYTVISGTISMAPESYESNLNEVIEWHTANPQKRMPLRNAFHFAPPG